MSDGLCIDCREDEARIGGRCRDCDIDYVIETQRCPGCGWWCSQLNPGQDGFGAHASACPVMAL